MNFNRWIIATGISILFFQGVCHAAEESASTAYSRDIQNPYGQILTFRLGMHSPQSIAFTNWNNYSFNFNDQKKEAASFELGWEMAVFAVGKTTFYISETVSVSSFSLKLPPGSITNTGGLSANFALFGMDSRIGQAWEGFPVAWIKPFWDAGYRFSLYNQTGSSELVAGEGSAGNWTAGLGMRFWVNRGASINSEFPGRYIQLPIFLTAKLSRIFPNRAGVDPGATTISAGLSVGL